MTYLLLKRSGSKNDIRQEQSIVDISTLQIHAEVILGFHPSFCTEMTDLAFIGARVREEKYNYRCFFFFKKPYLIEYSNQAFCKKVRKSQISVPSCLRGHRRSVNGS